MSEIADPPKKRGRPPLERSPEEAKERIKETYRKATKKRTERLKYAGKERMEAFVSPGVRDDIELLKHAMELNTQGDVIDQLVAAEIKRRKLY